MNGSVRHPVISVKWSRRYSLWSEWETLSKYWPNPGIYVVCRRRPLRRLGGVDPAGVLYVGKSSHVARRLQQFVNRQHPASDYLCHHLPMARQVLGHDTRTVTQAERSLEYLLVRVATVIPHKHLDTAEQAVLFAYLYQFGEVPPLNRCLPGRWGGKVPSALRAWGGLGIQCGA